MAAAASSAAWALEPQSIKLADGVNFTPTLQVSESYDDNFRASEDDEESTWITRITPTFALGAEGRKASYQLKYRADSDIIHSSRDDDNTDHYFTADAGFILNARNRLKLNAGYSRVELLDSDNLDNIQQNDKYNVIDVGSLYSFGAEGARGQIDLGLKHQRLRYENSDHINDDLERESTTANTIFYYRVAPKTRALVEARYTDFNYVSNDLRNSDEVAILGGLTWDATAKTTGTVKIGGQKKDFDDSTVDEMSGSMWEVGLDWKPRTYSTVSLKTHQAIEENYESGIGASAIDVTSTTLSWKHYWTTRLASEIGYTHTERDYEEYANYDRKDELDAFNVGLTFEMRRWLDLGLGYRYAENDSNVIGESYERNIFGLTVAASL